MNRRSLQKWSRKWHRRLGVVVGVQFLFWTLGGFYFSWFHIDNVRGKYERTKQSPPNLRGLKGLVSLETLLAKVKHPRLREARLSLFQGRPVFRLYASKDRVEMFDARTGRRLSPITQAQAVSVAKADFSGKTRVLRVRLVKKKGGEYKGPIPAYRVDFKNTKATHIYVHANTGVVTARRNAIWRGFDFLWMLHILDFRDRSDFNNWLLRLLSTLGLLTIGLGYLLWAVTTPWFRPKKEGEEAT